MLRTLAPEEVDAVIIDDPVRPHIPAEWRTANGRQVFTLSDNDTVRAVVCVAFCDSIPETEDDMNCVGDSVCVFYTVWSYDRGAGREIIFAVQEHLNRIMPNIDRWITLSPLTAMAERFHIRNGATLLRKGTLCQNFEYPCV